MGFSAIARIEHYKHYQAGAVHKEAVRELTGYSNPNWDPNLVSENVYFERMELDKPFEKWIYDFREKNGIVGRYIENSTNPKSETNAMCQALFTLPGYINVLSRDEQIRVLRLCYDFFKSEFPDCPVLEAVCHFDETTPHLQVNFLPVCERIHKKRGKERIFSTSLLMPGVDFFPKFQDRFFAFMENAVSVELERKKGSKAKHLAPKEYRAVTSEIKELEVQREELCQAVADAKEDYSFWEDKITELKQLPVFDRTLKLCERIRDLEKENKFLKSFLSYLIKNNRYIERMFESFKTTFRISVNLDKNR